MALVHTSSLFDLLIQPFFGPATPKGARDAAPRHPVPFAETAREAERMIEMVAVMLNDVLATFHSIDRERSADIHQIGRRLPHQFRIVKRKAAIGRQRPDLVVFAASLLQAGRVIETGLAETARKMREACLAFAAADDHELTIIREDLQANMRLASQVLMSANDPQPAFLLASAARRLDESILFAAQAHRLRVHECDPHALRTSRLYLSVLQDLKHINSHTSSVAYAPLAPPGRRTPQQE